MDPPQPHDQNERRQTWTLLHCVSNDWAVEVHVLVVLLLVGEEKRGRRCCAVDTARLVCLCLCVWLLRCPISPPASPPTSVCLSSLYHGFVFPPGVSVNLVVLPPSCFVLHAFCGFFYGRRHFSWLFFALICSRPAPASSASPYTSSPLIMMMRIDGTGD